MIPRSVLRHTITVEPYLGASAYGPTYGPAVTLRARVEGKRRMIRRPDGTEVISTASAVIRPPRTGLAAPGDPTVEVPVESRVTHQGRTLTVVDVLDGEALTASSHRELLLA